MGREIRRVPRGWEHPRDEQGHYQPLYDHDFETTAKEWKAGFLAWERGTNEGEFWEYHLPPDRDYCRPLWSDEERTGYQIYETVSEGTPVSPVFETKEQLIRWLIERGTRPHAAEAFAESGWVPSGIVVPQGQGKPPLVLTGFDSADFNER